MSVRHFSFVILGVATLFVGACEGEIGDHTSAAGGALGWRWRYGRGGHGGTPSVAGTSGSVAGAGGSTQPTGVGGAGAGTQPTGVGGAGASGGVGGTPTGTGNTSGGTAGASGSAGTPAGAAGKGGSTGTGTGGAVTGAAGKGGTTGTGGAGAVTGAAGKGGSTGTGGVTGTGGMPGGAPGPGPIAGSTIFFSDLTSGPNTGGQDGAGAFVTVWGNGFGDARGTSTVTIGGGAASSYPIWTSTKITFQLGASAKSGDIVVHVAGKQDSNALPFAVRSGNIYFVTATGSDSANGSLTSPWKTIPKAKNSIAAGDIAYIGVRAGDTVSQTTEDSSAAYRGALGMSANGSSNSGTATAPKALVAYPGARATIGTESGLQRGIMVPSTGGSYDYWVISQLSLRGEVEALDFSGSATGWRVIGNDISCPNGTGKSGCVAGADQTNSPGSLSFFGNVVHDAAAKAGSITKYYHGIYFASNHLDIGWNTVRDGKTCRAIQFHNSTAPNQFDIRVHDNVIHGTVCDGINFATIDPSKGAVVAYNNVIYDVGNGPDPSDGSSNYACVYVPNTTNVGTAGTGNVLLYNNTMYNCGGRKGSGSGAVVRGSGSIGIQMDDNLIVALSGETYISGTTSSMNGSNNLLSGAGSAPSFLSGSIASDPMFVGASAHDFHLSSGSPAVNAGKATAATMDIDGNPRPLGGSVDIGAYERAP